MIPKEMPWSNITLGKGQDHVLPAPAHIDSAGEVTIAFDLTDEEVEAIKETKTILVKQSTYNSPFQPVNIWVRDKNNNNIKDERKGG